MRRTAFIVLLMMIWSLASSQTLIISSDKYTSYDHDKTMDLIVNKVTQDYPCFFEFNPQRTIMTQTTSLGSSNYILSDYTEKDGYMTYLVTAETGSQWILFYSVGGTDLTFYSQVLGETGTTVDRYIEYNIYKWREEE